MSAEGRFTCPDAPFSTLRLEVWHRVPWGPDDFLGEVSLPLVHLMDLEPHREWLPLADPQGRANLPPGLAVGGELFLEAMYVTW